MSIMNLTWFTLVFLYCVNVYSEDNITIGGDFKGKIGSNLEVNFHMDNNNGKISGFYYYEKTGIDITIAGKAKNEDITLYELDYQNDTAAIIKGTLSDSIIKGEWINARNKKSYSLILKKTGEQIAPLLKNIEGMYRNPACDLSLTVSKIKGEYHYTYISKERTLKGKIRFSRGNENYIVLEGIQYSEDYFDGELPDDSEQAEQYERMRAEGKRHVGIDGLLKTDGITIQNYGNSMSYYVKLYDCDQKYIEFTKE